ncbi:Gmad2 immunoglobulin-like domain-containing protein [Actinotalea sp. JY-7876]|uniref:Gmad2 immunoglobulin-like domain-containing protein n=1 Tax=Actinotalea sp. JY-7876 TaxID=2758442 RepID=UPI0015F67EB0|nr:Gmad2 immunoglobulin-like domain-containing protein [Actinotalea sp. JY-7876]
MTRSTASPAASGVAVRRTTALRRTALALAVTGLVTGAAAACQTGTEEPATSGSPSASPTASSSATPSPSASATTSPAATSAPTEEPAAAPAVNGPNSITAPLAGQQVTSPVTATGEGTAYEATLSYRVVAAGTEDVVVEGWTEAGANGEIGPWSIELDLDPGTWTLQVWEASMSETEGAGASDNRVEVTFTVG